MTGSALKARFLRGTAWLAVGNVSEKILAFISKIVLARLLMPEDLGVVVLIASIAGLFECLTEVGVRQCVIQNIEGGNPEFLNMAWWFSALRGVGLFLIAWMLAPWVCHFYFDGQEQVLARYDWPVLITMVRVAFLNMLFYGLISPRSHLMQKEFRFARVVGYMQSAAVTGIILTIVLSFVLKNAWAMVLGFVCQGFLRMMMSYVFCPFLPRLRYHRQSMAEIMRFARGMWGAPFFAYIAYRVDVLVGGKVLGPELIGLYGFSVGLAYVPRDLFARIINPMLMPAFSECQDQPDKLRKTIGQLIGNLILISLPIILISFLFHRTLLTTIYGAEFESISLIFAIFTVNAMLIMLSMVFVNLCMALGRPEINRNFTFVRALLLACLTLPVVKLFGAMGMAIIQVIANLTMTILLFMYARRMISIGISDMVPKMFFRKPRGSYV